MKYLVFFFLSFSFVSGQTITDDFRKNNIENSTDIIKPNTLSTHPFGVFMSRINHNFKVRSPEKYSFSFEVSSGNVFLPYVDSYELTHPEDQIRAASMPWHKREFLFDVNTVDSKKRNFFADGVIRSYNFTFNLPLNANHEFSFGLRAFSLDKGKYPISVSTSDESIEWFHSNIAGGEDPFSRRYYGLNKARISYQDENQNTVEIENGDFNSAGLEINYFYYPELEINKSHSIYFNFGTHLGINTSKYNPVADIGFSASVLKKMVFYKKNILTIGLTSGVLRQGFVTYGAAVNFNDRKFFYSTEGLIDYKIKLKSGNSISYGINYTYQSSYNKKSGFDRVIFTGLRNNTHWQQTFSHLYESLQGWNAIFTYSVRRFSYFLYLREDLKLDNAPDLQTGIGLKMSIVR